jgi:hypothetical protein
VKYGDYILTNGPFKGMSLRECERAKTRVDGQTVKGFEWLAWAVQQHYMPLHQDHPDFKAIAQYLVNYPTRLRASQWRQFFQDKNVESLRGLLTDST